MSVQHRDQNNTTSGHASLAHSSSMAPWFAGARRAHLAGPHGLTKTIFEEMTDKAQASGAINLGQGFPDGDAPEEMLEIAQDLLARGHNQYAPGAGLPVLREAIAEHQQTWYRFTMDPEREVVVTTGATEAIAAAILAFTRPGDNLVTFEPFYDQYAAISGFSGAELRTVPLTAEGQQPDLDALEGAVDEKTRLIIVNDPHNPTGVRFNAETRKAIVQAAVQNSALIVSDEVYEHLVFSGEHKPFAHTPGAWERTITVSSAGKTFSLTGWKVGWATGPGQLIGAVRTVKQYLTYSSGPMFQPAVARGLGYAKSFFTERAAALGSKAGLLASALEDAGAKVQRPEGGFFVVADLAPLGIKDAAPLAKKLPELAGVVGIPVSAFSSPDHAHLFSSQLRFSACKGHETVEIGAARLRDSLADVAAAVPEAQA